MPIQKIARDGYESLSMRAVQGSRVQLINVNQEASYGDDPLNLGLLVSYSLPRFGGLSERHFDERFF